jgi:outer membrane protein OmpA-like peptidoglycan-associated protein
MKKQTLLGIVLVGLTLAGCHAQVKVQAKTAPPPEPPPPPAQPAPEPAPVAGEQVVLPDQIDFEFNEARIKQTPGTFQTLEALAELMKKHPNVTKLRIEGHTDSKGPKKANERLSKARADAVAKWLSEHDVAESRLVTIGFGSRRPLKPNDSEANRAQNRRTEYYVEEIGGKKVSGDGKSFESPPDSPSGTTEAGGAVNPAGAKSSPR